MPLSSDDITAAYAAYRLPVLKYCVRRLGDWHAGEDVAAAVWESLIQAADTYEDRGYSVSALLFQLARSRCADYVRRVSRKKRTVLWGDLDTATTPGPERVEWLDTLAVLRWMNDRQAVALALVGQGFTVDEIAARLGITHGAAGALIHRARERLEAHTHVMPPPKRKPREAA